MHGEFVKRKLVRVDENPLTLSQTTLLVMWTSKKSQWSVKEERYTIMLAESTVLCCSYATCSALCLQLF